MRTRRSPLALVAVGMTFTAVVFGALLLVDPRTIEGSPAWLKPAKFAVSTAIYSATLAWMFRYLRGWPRLTRVAGATTAGVFVVEVALIAVQAARGTTSHFNTSTLTDGLVFGVMGAAIAAQTIAATAVTVALWRERFADRAMGWALRLGMTLAIASALVGALMTQPTTAQLERARATGEMPRSGQHSVGGDDGGPGLPGTGWSTTHGDLRVPHFVGLHAMQVLPLVAFVLGRRRDEATRVRLVWMAGIAYTALFGLLFTQALAGAPIVAMSRGGIAAAAVWLAGTAVATLAVWMRSAREPVSRPSTLEAA